MPQTELSLFGPNGFRMDPDAWDPVGARGADKVADRFVYALTTPTGSVPGRPADGCDFTTLASGFRSEFDVFAAFAATADAAAATVRAAELAADPAGEKFGSARLTAVAISDGGVTLSLVIAALDGTVPSLPTDVTVDL